MTDLQKLVPVLSAFSLPTLQWYDFLFVISEHKGKMELQPGIPEVQGAEAPSLYLVYHQKKNGNPYVPGGEGTSTSQSGTLWIHSPANGEFLTSLIGPFKNLLDSVI
jgi:hypothetical protein